MAWQYLYTIVYSNQWKMAKTYPLTFPGIWDLWRLRMVHITPRRDLLQTFPGKPEKENFNPYTHFTLQGFTISQKKERDRQRTTTCVELAWIAHDMMNSSPDDRNSPNQESDETGHAMAHFDSLDRKISAMQTRIGIDIGPNDVLCGRSKTSFNHGRF